MLRSVPAALRFPDTVDEVSARLVATGVVAQAALVLVTQQWWLLVPLVYGFAARVLTGPTLSPLGLLATRVLRPRLRTAPRPTPGAPKRFAQAIGLAVTAGASVAVLAGSPTAATVVLAVLLAAASLEAFAGVCIGCIVHRAVWGCEDCADISERLRRAVAARQVADA